MNKNYQIQITNPLFDLQKVFALGTNLYLNIQEQDSINLKQLGNRLDLQLRKNYHYDYCRQLGQLKGTKVQIVSDRAMKYFVEAKHQKGTKLGDIKTRILTKSMGWSDILLRGA